MGNENIEKLMAFMLDQQTRFASKIGQLEDILGQAEDIIVRLAKGTLDRVEATDRRVDNIDERISALVDSQMRTEENVKKTDENLRNLIAVVDRYLSEGRNGDSTISISLFRLRLFTKSPESCWHRAKPATRISTRGAGGSVKSRTPAEMLGRGPPLGWSEAEPQDNNPTLSFV